MASRSAIFGAAAPGTLDLVDSRMTLLHYAVANDDPELAREALARSSDPERPNKLGETPYAMARRLGREKVAELLSRDPRFNAHKF